MTFCEAANLAKQAVPPPKELWLTHYSPMIEDPQEYAPYALCYFAKTVCGQDGLQKTLRFPKNPNIREKSVI